MCGIFGIIRSGTDKPNQLLVQEILNELYVLSESRGKEASGFALRLPDSIKVYKSAKPASSLIKLDEYRNILSDLSNNGNKRFAFIGHSRLVTNGNQLENNNNQPVVKDNIVGVHNGIVCNVEDLWEKNTDLERNYEVDTEIILSLLTKYLRENGQYSKALSKVFNTIEGAASIALLPEFSSDVLLATNTGSLHYTEGVGKEFIIFASERYIVKKLIDKLNLQDEFPCVCQLRPGEAAIINIKDCCLKKFNMGSRPSTEKNVKLNSEIPIINLSPEKPVEHFNTLLCNNRISSKNSRVMWKTWEHLYITNPIKRCTKCVLPATMTFIDFDEDGVCNYCREHKKFKTQGIEKLKGEIEPFLGNYDGRDCLVGISGGRDSCYGLHYIKEELGLNPIAFTFDWAVVTDLARRNISRMCGKLGIEHVIFSADINKKRDNIRKNLTAWLKRPKLGTIPLLMAGDKEMLFFGRKMIEQTGIKLLMWCNGHNYEYTPFKSGFAGMSPEANTFMNWVSWKNKLGYFSFFLKEVMLNPSYINTSIFDTFMGAMWQFVIPLPESTFLLYEYVPWDEDTVNQTLINQYNWEVAPDTTTTWRIGDGTAAFYNYIYMATAGISEHDTFRSAQVREGAVERSKALELIKEDNKPRIESLEWYANVVGFDVNRAIEIVSNMPKHYL